MSGGAVRCDFDDLGKDAGSAFAIAAGQHFITHGEQRCYILRRISAADAIVQLGGFDAVIGNPPWDRMKLQQVEWFAARRRDIAMAARAADRARMIAALTASGDPLAQAQLFQQVLHIRRVIARH